MLRLDAVLGDLLEEDRPTLLSDVLREDGPDVSAPVGDTDRGGEDVYSVGEGMRSPKSSDGISVMKYGSQERGERLDGSDPPPSTWSVSALYRT